MSFICLYCDQLHSSDKKLCLKIQKKYNKEINIHIQKYNDMKKYYESSTLNLETKLFEIGGKNIILSKKITKLEKELEKEKKSKSWFF